MKSIPNIPWPRIFAEGAIIVASILLAFWIDAWWNEHQDRDKEHIVLLGLKTEFEDNLRLIDIEIGYRKAVSKSILRMFAATTADLTLRPEELDRLLGDITWWSNTKYRRGTIDDLLQGGGLSLIENRELRGLIASLPSRYDQTAGSELNDQSTTKDVIIPYLTAHASLSQIANTMVNGRPGTAEDAVVPVYPVVDTRDHSSLLRDQEFVGILVQEHWNHLEALIAYGALTGVLQHGIYLIDQELNR